MKFDFTGKKVLVTGGTRGIGKTIADDFFDLGADLIITGQDSSKINELNSVSDKRKTFYCVDFTDEASSADFIAKIEGVDRIDICVNNAGINKIALLEETDPQDWDNIVAVNLKGPYLTTRAVSVKMKKNKYGRIINISSIFGVVSKEKRSIYSTTKSGLIGFTKAVSNELAKYNVLVNCLSPGVVKTDLTRKILGEKGMRDISRTIPIGRLAEKEEISKVAVFLASDLNTYLTGKNIIVDGGFVDV